MLLASQRCFFLKRGGTITVRLRFVIENSLDRELVDHLLAEKELYLAYHSLNT